AELTPLETDSLNVLLTFLKDIPRDEWKTPGEDAEFDARIAAWMKDGSVWVPLRVLLDSKPEELEKAGYSLKDTEGFLAAYRALKEAEAASPGRVAESKTAGLLAAARALGTDVQRTDYPTTKEMELEAHFNETNPFFRAPYGYGLAMAFLAVSLGLASARRGT